LVVGRNWCSQPPPNGNSRDLTRPTSRISHPFSKTAHGSLSQQAIPLFGFGSRVSISSIATVPMLQAERAALLFLAPGSRLI
jgi:hypothetical protein